DRDPDDAEPPAARAYADPPDHRRLASRQERIRVRRRRARGFGHHAPRITRHVPLGGSGVDLFLGRSPSRSRRNGVDAAPPARVVAGRALPAPGVRQREGEVSITLVIHRGEAYTRRELEYP